MTDQADPPTPSLTKRWPLAAALTAIALAGLTVCGSCATRRHGEGDAAADPAAPPPWSPAPAAGPGLAPAPMTPVPQPRARLSLDTEPTIGVFLLGGDRVAFITKVAGRVGGVALPAGAHLAQADAGGIRLDGLGLPADAAIDLDAGAAGGARFAAELDPPIGPAQKLSFAGQPTLHLAGTRVELIERVPLETYLAGVLPTEMSATWPLAALSAQAVAARSYAVAKASDRAGAAWQLHWHYTVDMAYAGVSPRANATVRQALADTRGWILTSHGSPVLALFHACSGGRTESARNVFGPMLAADGATDVSGAMPVVDDAAAEGGATGLGLTATHWRWKATIPLADITSGLAGWAREHPERHLAVGTVLDVRTAGRFTDSGRVSSVAIRERIAGDGGRGREVTVTLPAQDFRMAVGPGVVRSTWWDRCVTASGHGGSLVLAGRGFGHGVGLSQVSAWRLAQQGSTPEDILGRFYPGAALVHTYP